MSWLKRDLRTRDHAPLARAMQQRLPTATSLWCCMFEPGLTTPPPRLATSNSNGSAWKTWQAPFTRGVAQSFVRLHAPMLDVLDRLHAQTPIQSLHSHEETGWRGPSTGTRRWRLGARASGVLPEEPQLGCSVDAPTDGVG